MLLDTVLQKTDDQSSYSARRRTSKSLEYELLDRSGLVQTASSGNHGGGEGLQEETTRASAARTNNGVTERSEGVFLCGNCRSMAAKNPGEDLN
jgi:hypothetical protein